MPVQYWACARCLVTAWSISLPQLGQNPPPGHPCVFCLLLKQSKAKHKNVREVSSRTTVLPSRLPDAPSQFQRT